MAERPVFITRGAKPYSDTCSISFTWHAGMSVAQKQRSIASLHEAFSARFPSRRVLEISSKSPLPLGVALSAFNLRKYVPSLGRSVPVECVFQGGKVFTGGGPYTDLLTATSREAKCDHRIRESGALRAFSYEGDEYPLTPTTAFYNWLYINTLIENEKLAEQLVTYDSFTDIEFNPEKSRNCQAAAAAMFVSLHRAGLLDQCRNFDDFVALMK